MIAPGNLIAVYIIASRRNGTLYTGVTSNLHVRVWQHKSKRLRGFTAQYDCKRLVWFEPHASIVTAIRREKWVKHQLRATKLRLIEEANPEWRDLSDGWYEETTWDFSGAHDAGLEMR
ncbi:MAG TPA: GIY-YIG nuclease family protein [Caulobacteraceae bacterium]|jgi:putative endonuclease